MKRHAWTDQERDVLRALYPDYSAAECASAIGCSVSSVNNQAHALGLRKSREWIARRAAERSARPDHGGRAHQFRPGHATWNKGTPFNPGGRSVETRFKPGRQPTEARNYAPIGSTRITRNGILERKINDDHPIPDRRWVAEHRLVWETAHGPIPDGHIVVFKRGMHTTDPAAITADRLELVTRAENMARNTLHRYPKEVAQLIQLRGALNRKINARTKDRTT